MCVFQFQAENACTPFCPYSLTGDCSDDTFYRFFDALTVALVGDAFWQAALWDRGVAPQKGDTCGFINLVGSACSSASINMPRAYCMCPLVVLRARPLPLRPGLLYVADAIVATSFSTYFSSGVPKRLSCSPCPDVFGLCGARGHNYTSILLRMYK